MTKSDARRWLGENWGASPDLLDCIEAQGGFAHLDARAEVYAGQAWDPGPESAGDALTFALTGLVECHDGPHTSACPDGRRGLAG